MAEKHESLVAALAAFQAELPDITKNARGQARGGQTKYADLAEVSSKVMPVLGKHGLSFTSRPTITEDGRFVLAYALRHESGGCDEGMYPLPDRAGPQEMGSSITYARRYTLMAVTGVAPDEDDDGRSAQTAYEHRSERRAPQQAPARNGRSAPSQAPESAAPVVSKEATEALEELAALCDAMGLDRGMVAEEFARRNNGADVRKACTPEHAGLVREFIKAIDGIDPTRLKKPAAAANGAQSCQFETSTEGGDTAA